MINSADSRLRDGSSHSGPRLRFKCATQTNLGTHGQSHTTMVSYSIVDGEATEGPTHGKTTRNYSRYRRCEHLDGL